VHKQYELIGQRGPVMHPAAAPGIKWRGETRKHENEPLVFNIKRKEKICE